MGRRKEIKIVFMMLSFILCFLTCKVAYASSDTNQDTSVEKTTEEKTTEEKTTEEKTTEEKTTEENTTEAKTSVESTSEESVDIHIVSPLNDTQCSVGDTVKIEATATKCENITLYIDDVKVEGIVKNENNYSIDYIFKSVGVHKIQFKGTDVPLDARPSDMFASQTITIAVNGISGVNCTSDTPYKGTEFHFVGNIFSGNDIEKAIVIFKNAKGEWPKFEDVADNDKYVMNKDIGSLDNLYKKDIAFSECGTYYYKIVAKDKSGNVIETPENKIYINDLICKDNWQIKYDTKKKTIEVIVCPKVLYKNNDVMPKYSLAIWNVKADGSKKEIYKGTEKEVLFGSKVINGKYHKILSVEKIGLKIGQKYIIKIVSSISRSNSRILSKERNLFIKKNKISDKVLSRKLENGETVIWDGCTQKLLDAKYKFVKLIKKYGWKIKYNSAYRPVCYQKHLYDLNYRVKRGTATRYEIADYRRHGICGMVAMPSSKAPHCKGKAFDAIIYDKSGHALNGSRYMSSKLRALAKQAGLFSIHNDNVHFQVK